MAVDLTHILNNSTKHFFLFQHFLIMLITHKVTTSIQLQTVKYVDHLRYHKINHTIYGYIVHYITCNIQSHTGNIRHSCSENMTVTMTKKIYSQQN